MKKEAGNKTIVQKAKQITRFTIKHVVILANLFFALCYLFGVLSTVVSPNRVMFFAYFGLFFPIIVAVNFLFILFWAFKRSWYVLISALIMIFTFSHINNAFTIPFYKLSKHTATDTIKLMSYNILSVDGPKDFEGFLAFVDSVDADIVCFQEFGYYKKGKKPLEKAMKSRYPYSHIWYKHERKRYCSGNATFSKYPIIKKELVDFQSRVNVSIMSDIVINNDTIRLVNNHLESNKFSKDDISEYRSLNDSLTQERFLSVSALLSRKLAKAYKIRASQAVAVRKELDESPHKTIVCGDFNDVPESYTYRKIQGDRLNMFTSTCWGYRHTYYSHKMLVGIDHVFVDKAFVPISLDSPQKKFSDHYPQIALIGLKSEK